MTYSSALFDIAGADAWSKRKPPNMTGFAAS